MLPRPRRHQALLLGCPRPPTTPTVIMFRNNYDNDSVTFSPQGRIFQVEYAQEAVKQGSVVVGIVSKTHAVLAAIKVTTSNACQKAL